MVKRFLISAQKHEQTLFSKSAGSLIHIHGFSMHVFPTELI